MKYIIITVSICISLLAHSKTWHDVTMDDKVEVSGQELQLNGMALRKVTRFFVSFPVYVGGLYLKASSKDSQAILDSSDIKYLDMQFVRAVGRAKIRKGFTKGYNKSCGANCKKFREKMEAFNNIIQDIGKNERMSLTFNTDSVTVEMKGKNKNKGTIQAGPEFNKVILGMYISEEHPPSARFRKEILGITRSEKNKTKAL